MAGSAILAEKADCWDERDQLPEVTEAEILELCRWLLLQPPPRGRTCRVADHCNAVSPHVKERIGPASLYDGRWDERDRDAAVQETGPSGRGECPSGRFGGSGSGRISRSAWSWAHDRQPCAAQAR
ncbi:hypothetical protein Acor_56190 [Acrocarpospora corrugata]|uniref:Uncharacterized protein n=1 Tax=Acrocarpospora corrugata TaxID=35763 RepID=A0A5M3W8Q2_9ACTN|nr:hypothetical protein Acor_56190 [Acrocarpospora corrugata]